MSDVNAFKVNSTGWTSTDQNHSVSCDILGRCDYSITL